MNYCPRRTPRRRRGVKREVLWVMFPATRSDIRYTLRSISPSETRGCTTDVPWRPQTAHKKQVLFDHPYDNQVTHAKNKSFSARTQKPNQFRPPHNNRVNFGTHTKINLISIPHTKIKLISTPTLRSSQFRCPNTKNKISMQALKPSNSDPHTKT